MAQALAAAAADHEQLQATTRVARLVAVLQERVCDPNARHPVAMLGRLETDLRTMVQMIDR